MNNSSLFLPWIELGKRLMGDKGDWIGERARGDREVIPPLEREMVAESAMQARQYCILMIIAISVLPQSREV